MQPTRPTIAYAPAVRALAWLSGVALVVIEIVYSMSEVSARWPLTVASVLAFGCASVLDAFARYGARAAGALLAIAGGGGLLAEAVGLHTSLPFGAYHYTSTLGVAVLGVPLLVPAAWVMMVWPSVLVGRALARDGSPILAVVFGAWALAAWDLFLDPQMVDAGHWVWEHPAPALPGGAGVPVTNFVGWLLVGALMVAALSRVLPRATRRDDLLASRGPAPLLYVWAYGSSIAANLAFFDRPLLALTGGIVMGAVVVPLLPLLWRAHR